MYTHSYSSDDQVIIVGGGLFGLTAAIVFAEEGYKVTVVEKNYDVMLEATLVNQNRIHYGYHYPRSIQTGRESLDGIELFKKFYGKSIHDGFPKYYGIAKTGSHITASEFEDFCKELNIPLEEAWPSHEVLNHEMLEACWKVYEPVFDYYVLRDEVMKRVYKNRNIQILRNAFITDIDKYDEHKLRLTLINGYRLKGSALINATYSGLGEILRKLYGEVLRAKFQLLVLPVLQIDQKLPSFGVTIMDGPFCSLVPKGFSKNEYILSHVKHSVIESHLGYYKPEWNTLDGMAEMDIIKHCIPYYPILEKMKVKESLITTKMILPDQEIDDARPTLVFEHDPNVFSVFSGKVTTCVSAAMDLLQKLRVVSRKK